MATPLYRKLGIKEGFSIYVSNSPKEYRSFFEIVPDRISESKSPSKESIDFVHAFCRDRNSLIEAFLHLKPFLKKSGALWISWPKGSSNLSSEINREDVREEGLSIGLVDVKVASIDEDWSALKFVYRTKDR